MRLSPFRKTARPPSGLLAGPHTFSCTVSKSTSLTHGVRLAHDVHTVCVSTSLLAVPKEINMHVCPRSLYLSIFIPNAHYILLTL